MNLTNFSKKFTVTSTMALVLLALSLLPKIAQAQIEKDTTHWNDEDLYVEEKAAPSFFAVGGGVLGGYFMPNLGDFNLNVGQPFVGQNINEKVWMIGGQGFISVPWVKNLRVGGMGSSGAADCGCLDTTITTGSGPVNRFLEYEVGYGALTLDYVLPFRTGRFHIVPGVALGYGSVNIYARQAHQRAFDLHGDFDPNSQNITHTYTSHFFLYMPQLQFEYAPLGYMMVRLSAGYQGTSMGAWTVDRDVALTDYTPLKNVNGSGPIFSLGIFFGLFQ
jgi:hypothetical protein